MLLKLCLISVSLAKHNDTLGSYYPLVVCLFAVCLSLTSYNNVHYELLLRVKVKEFRVFNNNLSTEILFLQEILEKANQCSSRSRNKFKSPL